MLLPTALMAPNPTPNPDTPVGDAGQVGVALLRVLAHHQAVIVGVGGEEVLRVVVGVDDDLAQSIMHMRVGAALADEVLQEGRQQLEPAGHTSGGSTGTAQQQPQCPQPHTRHTHIMPFKLNCTQLADLPCS
jgi:hypothetical protein